MASHKVLAQLNPAATTSTALYTCPAGAQAKISTIILTNISASAITFRLSVAPLGATLATKQYIYYGTSIPANDTLVLEFAAFYLNATDVIRVYASDTNLVANVLGHTGDAR